MTSTNVNIGLEKNRSSSRVLMPPGGGHTPLFEPAVPAPPRRDFGRNASSITEGRSEPKPTPACTPDFQKPQAPAAPSKASEACATTPVVTPSEPVACAPTVAAAAPAIPTPTEAAPAPKPVAAACAPPAPAPVAAQRTRIPPGGFSSALW